jgi:lysophospholipase L1-like esterase
LSEPALPDLSVPESLSPDASLPDEPSVPTLFTPEQPPVTEPAPVKVPEPEPPKEKALPPDASHSQYDFSQPVPEREPVDMSYFSTAAFVGDSRSEGFYLYAVKRGKNLSSSGLSVFTFTQKKAFTIGGKRYTGLQALALKDYERVYLGFGVNELGYVNTEKFYKNYCATIDAVRACQPYAVVYAQTMAPVNEAQVAANGGPKHLNNDRVRLYNDLIRKAAQEKQVPLLDIYSVLAVDGSLPADAGRDGIHIHREYCQKQLDYLMRHTVDFDTLYPQPEPEVPANETTDASADGIADADGLLPQPGQGPIPAEADPTDTGN